jgi:hypothetical protein
METKKCTTCKKQQPLNEFRKDASRSDGIHKTCNTCNAELQRKWYQKNKEKAREKARERYYKNKELISAKRKQDRIDNPEKYKKHYKYDPIRSKEYGWKRAGIKNMTYERYLELLDLQNHCCAICGIHDDECKRQLSVDHDHNTGEVRGLLCDSCNGGIGKLKDSIDLLEKAINYLK